MKRFILLHYGFENPTPEIMKAWGERFEAIADRNVDPGGFGAARSRRRMMGPRDVPIAQCGTTPDIRRRTFGEYTHDWR
jgi:hypothetical protein